MDLRPYERNLPLLVVPASVNVAFDAATSATASAAMAAAQVADAGPDRAPYRTVLASSAATQKLGQVDTTSKVLDLALDRLT